MTEYESKYRVDRINGTTLRLTIVNVEIGDTGIYVFMRGPEKQNYSLIFHGKYKILYGKFAACSRDTAYRRDAHSGAWAASQQRLVPAFRAKICAWMGSAIKYTRTKRGTVTQVYRSSRVYANLGLTVWVWRFVWHFRWTSQLEPFQSCLEIPQYFTIE